MVKSSDGGLAKAVEGRGQPLEGGSEIPAGSSHIRRFAGPTTPGYARLGFTTVSCEVQSVCSQSCDSRDSALVSTGTRGWYVKCLGC